MGVGRTLGELVERQIQAIADGRAAASGQSIQR